jgi:hypothetical protein
MAAGPWPNTWTCRSRAAEWCHWKPVGTPVPVQMALMTGADVRGRRGSDRGPRLPILSNCKPSLLNHLTHPISPLV